MLSYDVLTLPLPTSILHGLVLTILLDTVFRELTTNRCTTIASPTDRLCETEGLLSLILIFNYCVILFKVSA